LRDEISRRQGRGLFGHAAARYQEARPDYPELPEPARESLLDRLASIAEDQFGGAVERRIVTPVYLDQRIG
jgi:hypothetical protein